MKPNIVFLSGDKAAPAPAEAATEIGAHPSMPRRRWRTRLAGWVTSPSCGLALLLISAICMGAGLWHLAALLWHAGV